MKKEVLFVLLNEFADWEVAFLTPCLNQGVMPGSPVEYVVKTISFSKEPITSIGGFKVIPDYDFSSRPKDYAALILVGGNEWFTDEASFVNLLVKEAITEKKIVAGICNGSIYLGMQGVLNNVKHTSNGLTILKQYSKEAYTGDKYYVQGTVVRDGNIITANGTQYLEFAKEILIALSADSPSRIEECYDFFKNDGISKRQA